MVAGALRALGGAVRRARGAHGGRTAVGARALLGGALAVLRVARRHRLVLGALASRVLFAGAVVMRATGPSLVLRRGANLGNNGVNR